MRTLYLSMVLITGIVMTVSLLGNQIFADNTNSSMASINVQIDKSNPDKPQIMITGTVYKIFSPILVIIVSDPFDQKLAISQLTPSTDGHFSETLFAAGPLWIKSGNYSISVVSGSQQLVQAKFHYDGTKPCCITAGPLHIDSPLKQFKTGVAAKDVTCKENLELILKTKDNSPICVKSDTAITLIKRGWAMSSLKNFGYNPGRGPVSLESKGSGNIITNSSSALKLSLSTNSTIIQSGQAIGITMSVDNTSPSLLTMNTQNNWSMQGLDLGDCSSLPMGVAILDGYYTMQNMSDGHPMILHFLYPCPPSLSVKSFTFQPMSSNVTTTCESGDWAPCQPLTQTKASVAYSSFLQNKQFFNFNSGNYTIVAGDEWGHVAIRHFIVIPPLNDTNPAKPKATSEIKNSSSLQLFLSIDYEYENPAEPISIDIGLNNTGSVPLTLAKSDNWPRNDLGSGLCSNLPFGISVLKGYYTEQNMSSAKSLVIYDTVPCPAPALIKSYTFEPSSSKATQECDTLFSCPGPTYMKAHLVIPDFMYNGQHHSFDVGKYTLVGGDEWGHVVIQHFTEEYATAYSEPLVK